MSIKIGDVFLTHGLFLAPMAGVTDSTFRSLCKRFGAEYMVSEMVSAKALCYEQRSKRKEFEKSSTAYLAAVNEEEYPIAIQLFGSEPDIMAEAARMIEACDYKNCVSKIPPAAIDINMGCPVRKITGNGEGSALMKDVALAGKIVAAVSGAVKLPVTVKIRAGWDENSKNAVEMAKVLEQSGAACICVHARTKEQMYSPGIDLDIISKTKKAVSVPVIGNGDIYCADDAVKMFEETNCDGVMIGRGATGNPWIFKEISARLDGKDFSRPDCSEMLSVALEQLKNMMIAKGERVGLAEGKKHMAWYIHGINGAAAARAEIMTAEKFEQIAAIFERLSKQ